MSLAASLRIVLGITHTKATLLTTLRDVFSTTRGVALTDGDGANQADRLYYEQRTLADGANETLDLHDGSLKTSFGDAITFDTLKGIYIKNNSTDAALLIGGAAATQLGLFADPGDILRLPPGGEFLFLAPNAAGVSVETNSNLKLTHDGTGSSNLLYDIMVVGVD